MGLWDTVVANVVSGLVVAGAAAGLGLLVAAKYTSKRETVRAGQERDRAAAAELYRVYGGFLAAWKVWNAHLRNIEPPPGTTMSQLGPPDDQRRSELLAAAAEAEGGFEALLIRLTLEHDLNDDQRAALWCLRSAFKQLRRAMRDGQPLQWQRSAVHRGDAGHEGYRAYQAFKKVTSLTADMLLDTHATPPAGQIKSRLLALRQVTGPGQEFINDKRFEQVIKAEGDVRAASPRRAQSHWEWVVIAEQLPPTEVTTGGRGRAAS